MGAGATAAKHNTDEEAPEAPSLRWAPSVGVPSIMSKKNLLDFDQDETSGEPLAREPCEAV